MSLKYQRIKQTDLELPAPLRWLTRAFSSITLAVILLVIVLLYSVAASVPVFFLVLAGLYGLVLLGTVGVAVGAILLLHRKPLKTPRSKLARLMVSLALLLGSLAIAAEAFWLTYEWAAQNPWLQLHRATVIYRLPYFEMTELEFYAWWPLQVVLILFVINLIWATVRRIEFKFVNLGVLTVHTGIVVMALGSIFYGRFKLEGDTILWRQDLGGTFETVFYDGTDPALYVTIGEAELMMPLLNLPRYNDYNPGELDIRLHERPAFQQRFGEHVRMTIPGFLAFGELQTRWRAPQSRDEVTAAVDASPAIELSMGDSQQPSDVMQQMLVAAVPADRVMDLPGAAIEYLLAPGRQRLDDLRSSFAGPYGLVVTIPEKNFRQVYAIQPGQEITLGDTGYTATVRTIGPYGMSFVTEGYRGATDTQAIVHVTGNGKTFTRIALHRYPERSQDFLPAPDDPSVGPMGKRVDPDPAIHMAFLDNSKPQYHIIAETPDSEVLSFIVRIPDAQPVWSRLADGKFPVPTGHGGLHWLHVTQQLKQAVRVVEPAVLPKRQRDPKDEGTYVESVLPVQIEVDLPADQGGGTWQRLVWLRHMRYPKYPDAIHRPVFVDVPTVGQVQIAFSRVRYQLPFAIGLLDFEMTPYPGSEIPQDFESTLMIQDLTPTGEPIGEPQIVRSHLNNPVVHRAAEAPLATGKIKLSQTGWDPPNPQNPDRFARNEDGRFINQQRFTILGVGNNVGIRIIFIGSMLLVLGIPWAFYVKPWLLQRQKRKLQRQLAEQAISRTQKEQPSLEPASPIRN